MQLGDICAIRSGLTLRSRPSESAGGILSIQQGDLSPEGNYEPRTAVRIEPALVSPHHLATPGDVIFRSRGPFWSAWAVDHLSEPLVSIAPLFIIQPTSDIDPTFLAWTLGRPAAQRYFAAEAKGTDIKMISKPVLAGLPFEWPPLNLQQSISRHAALAVREAELGTQLAALTLTLTQSRLDEAVRSASTPPDRKNS